MSFYDVLLAKKLNEGSGGDITVEGLSVTENKTYTAPSGKAYSPVVVNVPGVTYERLCLAEYVGNDSEEIPTMDTLTEDTNFSTYLSYDSETKKFTVLADFDAFIVPYVYTYQTPSGSYSYGALYINDTQEVIFHCPFRQEGSIAGYPVVRHMTAGESFYSYTPYSDGYPQQMLKVYRMVGATASDVLALQTVMAMTAPT